jgi:hypothetical protein
MCVRMHTVLDRSPSEEFKVHFQIKLNTPRVSKGEFKGGGATDPIESCLR